MIENYKIASCPHCAAPGKLVPRSKTIVRGQTVKTCYVECIYCHCRGSRFILSDFSEPKYACKRAVDSWNMRAEPNYTVFAYTEDDVE